MATPTFTKTGTKSTSSTKLDKSVFGLTVENHDLLKSAYLSYLANGRVNLAKVKTRGEISGGGIKPWRQKGTGRARVGSSRNPIWRGGGIVFGPTGNENYSRKLHKTAKRLAVRQALSLCASSDGLIVIEDIVLKSNKTKNFDKLLLSIGATNRVLLVVHNKAEDIVLASRNIERLTMVQPKYLNTYDILNADHVVITSQALSAISDWIGGAE